MVAGHTEIQALFSDFLVRVVSKRLPMSSINNGSDDQHQADADAPAVELARARLDNDVVLSEAIAEVRS